ncbi:hypothetical protein NAC36_002432 [Staphylococcus pseudintermedius]|uniref:hypothetical protein n=1 Tax=Staphylococcus pseudintermedius TaxID=283734 RepID=UPI0011212BDD|nr:hypothetical protein [Staphylococcus pseudintermedius]EGQ3396909.1 hypothetical protein [Staphylococcus pseudintermedius]EHV5287862.1 hypothetical protein [Staphylococcus pseudintermedius]EII2163251.1 hypothetical protein [Staphylococcus pseudintermedius]EIT1025889.1 hypothetical protein [Staphylococcus pseudintermedius]EJD8527475.1 hypothetical protein [Staphylococcus pseudintermedius]
MVEFDNAKSFSATKYNTFLSDVDEHANHLKRCAEIILQLETDASLTLDNKVNLKEELGTTLEKIKLDNQNIIDVLFTDYQVYEATKPRTTQDLSGFQMLKEKVASRDKNFKLSKEEAENDNSFYYRD